MTKRTQIANRIVNDMKAINGAPPYVFNLNNNVTRVSEVPDLKNYDFTVFPSMYVYFRTIGVDYLLGGIIRERLNVFFLTGFKILLTAEEVDDFASDMTLAVASDVKLGGLADSAVFSSIVGRWLEEENITGVEATMQVEFRRTKSER